MTTCAACQSDNANGYLCAKCEQTLIVACDNIAAYHADLVNLPITRAMRTAARVQRYYYEPAGSVHGVDAITRVLATSDNTLTTWARVLGEQHNTEPPRYGVTYPAFDLTNWLSSETVITWIRGSEFAGDMLSDLRCAEWQLKQTCIRNKAGWFAGECGAEIAPEREHDRDACACACGHVNGQCDCWYRPMPALYCDAPMFASAGARYVECPGCGITHDAIERRAVMLDNAKDMNLPASEIARFLVAMTDEESVSKLEVRIRQWAKRGLVTSYGQKVIRGQARSVYRVGDVLDRINAKKAA